MKKYLKTVLLIVLVLSITIAFAACDKGDKGDEKSYKLPASQFNQTYTALNAEEANDVLNALKVASDSEAIKANENFRVFGTMNVNTDGTPITTLIDAIMGVDKNGGTLLSGYNETSAMGFKAKGNIYITDNKMYFNVSSMGQTAKTYEAFSETQSSPYSAEMFDGYLDMIKNLENLEGVTVSAAKVGDELQYKFSFDKSFLEIKELQEYCELVNFKDFTLFLALNADNTVKGMKISLDYSYKFSESYIKSVEETWGKEYADTLKIAMSMKLNFEISRTDSKPTFPNDLGTYVKASEYDETEY